MSMGGRGVEVGIRLNVELSEDVIWTVCGQVWESLDDGDQSRLREWRILVSL